MEVGIAQPFDVIPFPMAQGAWAGFELVICLGYGTILYYYVAYLVGFNVFIERISAFFVMFILANLFWFAGYGYMVYDSVRVMICASA